jgi:flagellar FliJ protein
MQPVKRLSDDRAEAAAKLYAEAQQKLGQQQGRLQQLRSFREEYQQQRLSSAGTGMDGFRLRDYNAFIARIDVAVRHQQEALAQAEAEVARARNQWLEMLGRARAIEKVVENYQSDERRADERKDQRQNDELAQLRRPSEEET